jgi:imidazole glycerol phosphate synthase glutamine amidotransferase subunit
MNTELHHNAQVEVVGYGGGNLGSLLRSLERLNITYTLVQGNVDDTWPSGKLPLILPGVGAYASLMQALKERGLIEPIRQAVQTSRVPFLGVCVGLQVLFETSEEGEATEGFGFIKGKVIKFTGNKVPQIGWNYIHAQQQGWPEGHVYYVNSYYAVPEDANVTLYASQYEAERFTGAVHVGNITAFQFHPEKSGALGQALLQHWLTHCAGLPASLPV